MLLKLIFYQDPMNVLNNNSRSNYASVGNHQTQNHTSCYYIETVNHQLMSIQSIIKFLLIGLFGIVIFFLTAIILHYSFNYSPATTIDNTLEQAVLLVEEDMEEDVSWDDFYENYDYEFPLLGSDFAFSRDSFTTQSSLASVQDDISEYFAANERISETDKQRFSNLDDILLFEFENKTLFDHLHDSDESLTHFRILEELTFSVVALNRLFADSESAVDILSTHQDIAPYMLVTTKYNYPSLYVVEALWAAMTLNYLYPDKSTEINSLLDTAMDVGLANGMITLSTVQATTEMYDKLIRQIYLNNSDLEWLNFN